MKSFLGSLGVAVLMASSVFAAAPQKIEGHLVDVACANHNVKKPKAGFAASHGKDCLEMPECAESGYAIVTSDNKVIKFDSKGNETARKSKGTLATLGMTYSADTATSVRTFNPAPVPYGTAYS